MTGKGVEPSRGKLAELSVKAVKSVMEKENEKNTVDIDNIKIEKKVGGSIESSELIEGMVIDKERVSTGMPKRLENAKIALINGAIELKDTEVDAEISITSPDQLQAFLSQEEEMLKGMVNKITSKGANVVFCQKGKDDLAQHYLAKAGVLAARRVKKSDMEKLARAINGKITSSVDELEESDLGKAGLVEERKVGNDNMIFVERCENPKAVSIVLHGGTEHVVDDLERAVTDALRVVGVTIEDEKVVAGGGATEVELALKLRDYASTVGGREQLAINAFADALEVIPKTLAEMVGLDTIDTLTALRSKHEQGMKTAGLNVFTGDAIDMLKEGVVEPLRIKTQAIGSASESAVMILRIDDVIAASKLSAPEMPEMGEGGMAEWWNGGNGGMPPM